MSDDRNVGITSCARAGRPAHWVGQQHFSRVGNKHEKSHRYDQKCIHCNRVVKAARTDQLLNHLLQTCPQISPEDRVEVAWRESGGSKINTTPLSENAANTPITRPVLHGNKKRSFQQRLDGHVQPGGIPYDVQQHANTLQLDAAASTGIPFNAFADRRFRKWISYISRFSDYVPASKCPPSW